MKLSEFFIVRFPKFIISESPAKVKSSYSNAKKMNLLSM